MNIKFRVDPHQTSIVINLGKSELSYQFQIDIKEPATVFKKNNHLIFEN